MANPVSVPNSFTAGTDAVAAEVNANFTSLVDYINDNMVTDDGAVNITGTQTVNNLTVAGTLTAQGNLDVDGTLKGDVVANDGSSIVLSNGTNGSDATFKGDILNASGTTILDVSAATFAGNATTATKWASPTTLTVNGDMTGSVVFDGSDTTETLTLTADLEAGDIPTLSQYVRSDTSDTMNGKLTITGDMVADDVQSTTGLFYGGGSDSSQPNEYMQFSEASNYWRVVNDGGEDFRVDSSGYAYTAGRRYYFGIGSNDYILYDDSADEYQFIIDGLEVLTVADNSGSSTTGWASQQLVINDPRTSGSGTPGFSLRSAVLNYAAVVRLSSAAANRIVVRNSGDTDYGELHGDLTDTSSARWKEDIRNLADTDDDVTLDLLDVLHPRRYRMSGHERFGFVAEEIGEHVREAAEWSKPEESDLLEGENPDDLVALGYKPTAMNAVNYRLIQLLRQLLRDEVAALESRLLVLEG